MLERMKSELADLLEEARTSVLRAISSFGEKISQCNDSKVHSIINMVGNVTLPNIFKMSLSKMKRKIEDVVTEAKEEAENILDAMVLSQAEEEMKALLEMVQTAGQQFYIEKEVKEKKAKAAGQRADRLYQKIVNIEKPSLLKRLQWLLFGKERDRKKVEGYTHELLKLQGVLTLIKLGSRIHGLFGCACKQIEKFLRTELSAELEERMGKIAQAVSMVAAEQKVVTHKLAPRKGYQHDMYTREKLLQLSKRLGAEGRASLAQELREKLKDASSAEIIKIAKEKLGPLYEDVKECNALKRLDEVYQDHEELGNLLQSLAEQEGSPFIPLNDSLRDDNPFFTTTVGIADRDNKRVEDALGSRIAQGSNSVGYQADREKIIMLTTGSRIPFYALLGFREYMEAVRLKEQEGRFAVYSERRFHKYVSPAPTTSEALVETLTALGYACNKIKLGYQGWFRVNGRSFHGERKLKHYLAGDRKMQASIKDWWMELYHREGMKGVIERLTHARDIDCVNGISDILTTLINRLTLLKDEEVTQERFMQIIQGAR